MQLDIHTISFTKWRCKNQLSYVFHLDLLTKVKHFQCKHLSLTSQVAFKSDALWDMCKWSIDNRQCYSLLKAIKTTLKNKGLFVCCISESNFWYIWPILLATILDKISCKKIWKTALLKFNFFLNLKDYEMCLFRYAKLKTFANWYHSPAPTIHVWWCSVTMNTISCFNIVTGD